MEIYYLISNKECLTIIINKKFIYKVKSRFLTISYLHSLLLAIVKIFTLTPNQDFKVTLSNLIEFLHKSKK